ncbi:MAG: GH36-type glycosyl hydrolase domain-containing protein [Chthoniobacteraceae bacterium]
MSRDRVAEYVDNGKRYIVRDIHFLERADSHLFNDTMEIQMDQRGKCRARFMQPNSTPYCEPLRSFYLRDDATGEFWSVPFEPVQAEPQKFEFSPGLTDIQWWVTVNEIEAWIRVTIPREDQVELWTVTITNRSSKPRTVSLYPYFPVGQLGWISQISKYEPELGGIVVDYFPYYVKVEDYYKLRNRKNSVFCVADRRPASAETNHREFLGGNGPHNPAGLHLPNLGGNEAHYEPSVIVMQYPLSLASQETDTLNFVFGPAKDRNDIERLIGTYLSGDGVEKSIAKVQAYLESIRPAIHVETPDSDFNHFINYWLPQQIHFCGGILRMEGDPCVRNAYQDAMGATFILPRKARYWFYTICAHQHTDGSMPHGAPLADGVDVFLINTIPHRDMNVWPPLAISYYMKETGDMSILDEYVGFKDGDEKASVFEHVCRGLEWQLGDRTERNLCRLGQGDWDDPLNMAGWKEKGESVWLTEALAIALDTWAEVAEQIGDKKRAARYRDEAAVSRATINQLAWDGSWYARGTTDDGLWFGTKQDTEGKVFLNAQSWAMICGAVDSPKRVNDCVQAVNEYLMSPSGPMTMGPAFTHMREDIGKITQKTPGTAENGSVYAHAAAFYAYGLFRVRRGEEGFRVLRMLMVGTEENPLARAQQLPLYFPNYFRGIASGKTAGRSSCNWGTGTVAWFYRTVIGELLGIRGEFGGLRIDPQLPKAWDQVSVRRKFRESEFEISIKKSATVENIQITLDSEILPGNIIPAQEPNSKHAVQVLIPY